MSANMKKLTSLSDLGETEMFESRPYITNDPFTLMYKLERLVALHERGLITDKEFINGVKESVHRNTNLVVERDWED